MVTSAFSLAEYNPTSHNHQPFELPPADHDYPCFSDYLPTSDLGNFYSATPEIQSLHKSWVSEFDKLVRLKAAATTINPCSSVDKADEGVPKELSTEEIMRVAAARFVQSSAQTQTLTLSTSGLTDTEAENIELAVILLSAAEKVSNHQFDRARHLLQDCYRSSSVTGNPTQRIIYYFSEALYERIDRETGRLQYSSLSSSKRPRENGVAARNVVEAMLSAHPRELVIHKRLPFLQLMQFTSLQAIIDTVRTAKRIHMIDLSIRHGLQWAILLQFLAERSSSPVEYVKIRAVGASEAEIAATGKRLLSFSASLGIPLDFKAVVVADMIDLRVEMFEVGEGEVVAAYSSMDVNPMIARPESLENLMRVMRRLRPSIMTVVDVEAKHNSPAFITRFSEALFFYSSFFDSLDFFLERDDAERLGIEGGFHSQGIKNIVAAEGDDRVVRHVGIRVWRPYFARFGMEEVGMNEWATYQAGLLVNRFGKGSSCTVEKDGRSLLVGWKGTPIVFISAWRFC